MYQQLRAVHRRHCLGLVIGFTVKYLDTPTPEMVAAGIQHAIGEKYNAPQATLMATLIKGLLSFNLDWQFVLVAHSSPSQWNFAVFKSLSFAVGLYLPLSTTLADLCGWSHSRVSDWITKRQHRQTGEHSELRKRKPIATGLVAGRAHCSRCHYRHADRGHYASFDRKVLVTRGIKSQLPPTKLRIQA